MDANEKEVTSEESKRWVGWHAMLCFVLMRGGGAC